MTKICGFNADSREEIQIGFKGKISIEEAMTGKEFCDLLGIDYDNILAIRAADRESNYDVFLEELLAITSVKTDIRRRLSGD